MHYVVLLLVWLPCRGICSLRRRVGRFPFSLQELKSPQGIKLQRQRRFAALPACGLPWRPLRIAFVSFSIVWRLAFLPSPPPPKYLLLHLAIVWISVLRVLVLATFQKGSVETQMCYLPAAGIITCPALVTRPAACCWNNQVELKVRILMKLLRLDNNAVRDPMARNGPRLWLVEASDLNFQL